MSTVETTPEPGKKVDVKRMSWDPITRIVGSLGIHADIDFENRNFPQLVDAPPPFRRSRDAAAEIGPDRLKRLAAKSEHQCELVAVSRFREVMQSVRWHPDFPSALWRR